MLDRPSALATVLLLLVTGCDAEGVRDPAMDPLTPPGIPEVAPAETAPGAVQMVQLQEWERSGMRGRATLTPGDTVTLIEIELSGTRAGASHAARVYAGPCSDPGAVIAELDPILAQGERVVTRRTVHQMPLALLGGQASLMIYRPNGVVAGPGAACGEISRQPGIAPEPQTVVTEPPVLPSEPPVDP